MRTAGMAMQPMMACRWPPTRADCPAKLTQASPTARSQPMYHACSKHHCSERNGAGWAWLTCLGYWPASRQVRHFVHRNGIARM